jgi:O-antigen/teichoic acid export membrane protein
VQPALVWTGAALVPLQFYSICWRSILTGLGRFALVSRCEVALALFGTALTCVLLFGVRVGVAGLLAGTVAAAACGAAGQALVLQRIEPLRRAPSLALLAETMRIGAKGHLGNTAFFVLSRVDVFLVNLWLGASAVGCYGLATALAEKAWFLPQALSGAAGPELGRLEAGAAAGLALKSARHSLLLALAAALGVLAAAPRAVPLVYGEAFRPAIAPLLLILPGTVAVAVSLALSAHLAYHAGKPQLTAAAGWVAAALYLPAAVYAIPRAGLRGAALASCGAYLVLAALVLLLFRRETGARLGAIVSFGREDLRHYAALIPRRLRGERG